LNKNIYYSTSISAYLEIRPSPSENRTNRIERKQFEKNKLSLKKNNKRKNPHAAIWGDRKTLHSIRGQIHASKQKI